MTKTDKDPERVRATKAHLCGALVDALEKLHVAEAALWWAERRGRIADAPVAVQNALGRVRACVERHRAIEADLLEEVTVDG